MFECFIIMLDPHYELWAGIPQKQWCVLLGAVCCVSRGMCVHPFVPLSMSLTLITWLMWCLPYFPTVNGESFTLCNESNKEGQSLRISKYFVPQMTVTGGFSLYCWLLPESIIMMMAGNSDFSNSVVISSIFINYHSSIRLFPSST